MQINTCTTKSLLSKQTESIQNKLNQFSNSIHNATQIEKINPLSKYLFHNITLIVLPKAHQRLSVVVTFKSLPK